MRLGPLVFKLCLVGNLRERTSQSPFRWVLYFVYKFLFFFIFSGNFLNFLLSKECYLLLRLKPSKKKLKPKIKDHNKKFLYLKPLCPMCADRVSQFPYNLFLNFYIFSKNILFIFSFWGTFLVPRLSKFKLKDFYV